MKIQLADSDKDKTFLAHRERGDRQTAKEREKGQQRMECNQTI